MMMTKKTQHDLVAVAVEVTFDPSFLRKMTTVNDLVVALAVAVALVVVLVEVTIYSSSLWKTQKKNPS